MAELHYTFPVRECWGLGTRYGWTTRKGERYFHGGIDISHFDSPNTDLLAVKSGKIVASYDVGKDGYNGGNIIALEIPYSNTQKQWIVYQHCLNTVALRDVRQGEKIGSMGTSGASDGEHLHITFSQPTDNINKFSYYWVINNTIDPYEHILYRLKGIDYKFNDKPHDIGTKDEGQGSVDLKKIVEFTNIEPVQRNANVEQIEVLFDDTLNMRKGAGTNFISMGYAPKGFYNVLDKVQNTYSWYKIAEDTWVAEIDNYSKYHGVSEASDIEKLEEQLKEANEKLVKMEKLVINYDKTFDLIEENMNEILNGIKSVRALL